MADIAGDLKTWSTTAGNNAPSGATAIGAGLDDNLREIQKVVRQDLATKGSDIASAVSGTTDIGAVAGLMHDITGTNAITSLGTVSSGIWKILKFEGALTLTHNATSLILPGGANITTADGDVGIFFSEGSGNWRCVSYQPKYLMPSGMKRKNTDEARNSTTALAADTDLVVPIDANTNYYYEAYVAVSVLAASDFKFLVSVPAATTIAMLNALVFDAAASGSVQVFNQFAATHEVLTGSNQIFGIYLRGIVQNGVNAGNISFMWAQVTSGGSNTTVRAGSWARVTSMA